LNVECCTSFLDGAERSDKSSSPLAESIVDATPVQTIIDHVDAYVREEYRKSCDYNFSAADSDREEDDHIFVSPLRVLSRVLGDAFHVMDRVKVPMHHDFKFAYYRSLRAAILIFNPHDVDKLKKALGIESDPKAWERLLAFKFDFVAQRVRRRIPDADLLYERVKRVFDYYEDKKGCKKRQAAIQCRCKAQI